MAQQGADETQHHLDDMLSQTGAGALGPPRTGEAADGAVKTLRSFWFERVLQSIQSDPAWQSGAKLDGPWLALKPEL
eukprot:6415976-Pyramimonas_sp.AAC.1